MENTMVAEMQIHLMQKVNDECLDVVYNIWNKKNKTFIFISKLYFKGNHIKYTKACKNI